jgi:hypothetical protein
VEGEVSIKVHLLIEALRRYGVDKDIPINGIRLPILLPLKIPARGENEFEKHHMNLPCIDITFSSTDRDTSIRDINSSNWGWGNILTKEDYESAKRKSVRQKRIKV